MEQISKYVKYNNKGKLCVMQRIWNVFRHYENNVLHSSLPSTCMLPNKLHSLLTNGRKISFAATVLHMRESRLYTFDSISSLFYCLLVKMNLNTVIVN